MHVYFVSPYFGILRACYECKVVPYLLSYNNFKNSIKSSSSYHFNDFVVSMGISVSVALERR